MTNGFTHRLREQVEPIWEAQHRHPFVAGIGDGTLDLERLKFWVRQDYVFLIEYARLLALAAARSPDLETMTKFAELTTATLQTEMSLHREYAGEFGISREALEHELKAPTTQAYTDFLVRVAATGDFPELVSALLPCLWGFSEVGQRLGRHPRPADPRYGKWIDMYASQPFAELAQWCRDLLERLAAERAGSSLRRLEEIFLTSSRYEWLFWEMVWKMEGWPI
jgi:thiaminase (transcriptional activator TenA)